MPPTPVAAPWNGSTADGWLWLSTLSATARPSPDVDHAGVLARPLEHVLAGRGERGRGAGASACSRSARSRAARTRPARSRSARARSAPRCARTRRPSGRASGAAAVARRRSRPSAPEWPTAVDARRAWSRRPREQDAAVGRAEQRVDGVLGVRHQPGDVAGRVRDAGDRVRPSRSGSGRSGAAPGRAASSSSSWPGVGEVAAVVVLHGDLEACRPATAPGSQADSRWTRRPTSWQRNWRCAFGRSTPGSRPASVSTWKPLQMPEHRAARSASSAHGGHHRRERGQRARPQIVAVAEPAGDDHRVGAAQVGVGVPDPHRLGRPRARSPAARRGRRTSPGKATTPTRTLTRRPGERSSACTGSCAATSNSSISGFESTCSAIWPASATRLARRRRRRRRGRTPCRPGRPSAA